MAARKEIMNLGGREVTVTNPDKIFFPRLGRTKLDLVRYYAEAVPEPMPPHLRKQTASGSKQHASPEVWAHLADAGVLVDSMRGRSSTWTRIRVNLSHVPEAERPPQEALKVDFNPWAPTDRRST